MSFQIKVLSMNIQVVKVLNKRMFLCYNNNPKRIFFY